MFWKYVWKSCTWGIKCNNIILFISIWKVKEGNIETSNWKIKRRRKIEAISLFKKIRRVFNSWRWILKKVRELKNKKQIINKSFARKSIKTLLRINFRFKVKNGQKIEKIIKIKLLLESFRYFEKYKWTSLTIILEKFLFSQKQRN